MTTTGLSLSGLRNLPTLLERLPSGNDAAILARRLGIWTQAFHQQPVDRVAFPHKLSPLSPPELSDLYALWTSELGRLLEINGLLLGQQPLLRLRLRGALAASRTRTREANPDVKMTAVMLNDLAEDDPAVLAAQEQAVLVETILVHLQEVVKATQQYLTTISREIAFRDAQLRNRIY